MDTDESDVGALLNHGWQGMSDVDALITIRRAGIRAEQLSRPLSEIKRLADIRRLHPIPTIKERTSCVT